VALRYHWSIEMTTRSGRRSVYEHEYDLAKRAAQSQGISVRVRPPGNPGSAPPAGQGPWMRFAGMVESGNARSSQCVDDIVYGVKGRVGQRTGTSV
jgi:hypothetical protein